MNKFLIPMDLVDSDQHGLFTTSLKVAGHFHKKHFNVLRDIEKLLADCPDKEFSQLNFELASYLDEQKKPRPMYRLTEEGFSILAMGFTGSKALQWKIDFLQSFKQLREWHEKYLRQEIRCFENLNRNLADIRHYARIGMTNKQLLERSNYRSLSSITRAKRKLRQAGLLN